LLLLAYRRGNSCAAKTQVIAIEYFFTPRARDVHKQVCLAGAGMVNRRHPQRADKKIWPSFE